MSPPGLPDYPTPLQKLVDFICYLSFEVIRKNPKTLAPKIPSKRENLNEYPNNLKKSFELAYDKSPLHSDCMQLETKA